MSQDIASPPCEIQALLDRADGMRDSTAKVELLEEAVRRADALGDIKMAYAARQALIRAAEFSGYDDRALVAFSWCLAQSDRDPEAFNRWSLLWQYKWILGDVVEFPDVPLERIEELLDDFRRRLLEDGYGETTAHYERWHFHWTVGRLDAAEKYFRLWRDAPRSAMSDCSTCERHHHAAYLKRKGLNAPAVRKAGPILAGRESCTGKPRQTYTMVLKPLVELGRMEEAAEYHQRGYRQTVRHEDELSSAGDHLLYLVRVRNRRKAAALIERHLQYVPRYRNLNDRFGFYVACAVALEFLAGTQNRLRALRIPRKLDCYREEGRYRPLDLAEWFSREARKIGDRFDRRNGNNGYEQWLVDARAYALEGA